MDTALSQLGENEILSRLLRQLRPSAPMLVGPGDDCAVVTRNDEWDTLLKTDVVVEGVHFLRETEPRRIGRKALARAISDIAAMGGIPEHALITILVHSKRSVHLLEELYTGISEMAAMFGVSVAGGETSSLPYDGMVINVALTGRVERGKAILRSGGMPGDIICVSGPLGGSFPSEHHLDFIPRVELARALMNRGTRPTAMMDLSDGLAADLPRLATACRCGFELEEKSIPVNPGCNVLQALNDGEDYELLMTFSPETLHLQETLSELSLIPIGKLTKNVNNSLSGGWQHFVH